MTPGDHLQTAYALWLPGHQLARGAEPWLDPYSLASAPFQSEISGTSASSTSFQARCDQCESRETPNTRTPARSNSGLLSRRRRSSCVQVGDQSKR